MTREAKTNKKNCKRLIQNVTFLHGLVPKTYGRAIICVQQFEIIGFMRHVGIIIVYIYLTLTAQTSLAMSSTISIQRSFQSDQCTFWPDSSFSKDWSHCCYQHDFYYWAGGTKSERKQVDNQLKACITESSGPLNAALMNFGVRLGSLSPIKFGGKQWGNAWGDKVRHNPLSPKEIEQLQHDLFSNLERHMSHSEIDSFIQKLDMRQN